MNFSIKNELPILGIALLPLLYLGSVWNSLPENVPLHWNLEGEIDNWGSKYTLIGLVFLMPILTYILMLVVPNIDPKKRIEAMGGKYNQFKFILVAFMSILSIFIIYISKNQKLSSPGIIFVLVGILYVFLGNYFKVLKQNYFIGIKTPWTLENEEVWKLTHLMAGKMWVIGGLAVVILSFILPENSNFYFFMGITATISIVPIVYSYFIYKKLKNNNQ
jgi:uncharacterized membrane protein